MIGINIMFILVVEFLTTLLSFKIDFMTYSKIKHVFWTPVLIVIFKEYLS